jgi:hypothetical protein
MADLVRKVHLTSRIFDFSFLLEYSNEVPAAGIIPTQLVFWFNGHGTKIPGKDTYNQ